jgi:hypothetical protein
MRRFLPLVVLAAAAALVLPTAAGADKPVKEPIEFEPFVLEGVCSFPAFVEADEKEKARIFPDGVVSITGKFKARITNLDSGRSVELNVSGPTTLTPQPDGTLVEILRGHAGIILFSTDVGGPAFLLTTGRVVIVYDEEGNVRSFEHHGGTTTDICALLS